VEYVKDQAGEACMAVNKDLSIQRLLYSIVATETNYSNLSVYDYTKEGKADMKENNKPEVLESKKVTRSPYKSIKKEESNQKVNENHDLFMKRINERLRILKSSKSCNNLPSSNKLKSLKSRLLRQNDRNGKNDIREHPSIDDSKNLSNTTKEKYKKYITKKRSASKGVFEYENTNNE